MRVRRLTPRGFTLLEVLIAIAILTVAFGAVFMVENASLRSTERAKQIGVVAMLARNAMIESEMLFEGKTFEEVKEEESGQFSAPFQDYRWTRIIKEIKFPNMGAGGGGDDSDQGSTREGEVMSKLITNFLSKAAREVIVTVSWKKGSGSQSYSLSTYWVNLNHDFALSE